MSHIQSADCYLPLCRRHLLVRHDVVGMYRRLEGARLSRFRVYFPCYVVVEVLEKGKLFRFVVVKVAREIIANSVF